MTQNLLAGQFPSEEFMAGVLKLRGAPKAPATSAYPELEEKGVSGEHVNGIRGY